MLAIKIMLLQYHLLIYNAAPRNLFAIKLFSYTRGDEVYEKHYRRQRLRTHIAIQLTFSGVASYLYHLNNMFFFCL